MSVCPCNHKTPTSRWRLCLKNVFHILTCDHTIFPIKKDFFCLGGRSFFSEIATMYIFGSVYCGYWGSKEGKVFRCGCWLLARQWHFNDTSMEHQRRFYGTLTKLQCHCNGTKKAVTFLCVLPMFFWVFNYIIIKCQNLDKDGWSGNVDKVYCIC